MAALDFPNSPTVGQQYNAANGVTYQWDGAVWLLSGAWTAGPAGGDLSGTYPNPKVVQATAGRFTVPGSTDAVDQSAVLFGTRTVKGRLTSLPSIDFVGITSNRRYDSAAWQADDVAKASWNLQLRSDTDRLVIERAAAGTPNTGVSVGILDANGNLTITGVVSQLQHYARVSRSTVQAIPTGTTATVITGYDTVAGNPGGMWNAGTPDRLTVQQAGFYIFGGAGFFTTATGGGRRAVTVDASGVGGSVETAFVTGTYPSFAVVHGCFCSVGAVIRMQAMQDSGAALNYNSPALWAVRVV